jgi:hypothetical protein
MLRHALAVRPVTTAAKSHHKYAILPIANPSIIADTIVDRSAPVS